MFERNIDNYTIREQLTLYKASVAICGVGGGGCCVAEILCRTGVGHIILIDGDTFESSNKNRQIGATESSIGFRKTDIMKERLLDINPDCRVTSISSFIEPKNASIFLSDADVISDTVDGNGNKRTLFSICQTLQKPMVSGGLSGKRFQYFVIDKKIDVDLVRPHSDITSLSANPASVFVQAGFQAQLIIDYILRRDIESNVIYTFDADRNIFEKKEVSS